VLLPSVPNMVELTPSEKNVLCYLTGWLAFKLKTRFLSCNGCINFLVSSELEDRNLPEAQLVIIKSNGWLTLPSKSLQKTAVAAEGIFQRHKAECLNSSNALQLQLDSSASLLRGSDPVIPYCHDVSLIVLIKILSTEITHLCTGSE
jgi:hypothetical protein